MSVVEFPYRQRKYGDVVLSIALGCIALLKMQNYPGMFFQVVGVVILLLAALLLWMTLCSPRLLTIDTSTGIASFSPRYPFRPWIYKPISLRDYSSIYWKADGNGSVFSVELVNQRGESKRLLYKAPESDAEKLCSFISEQFGLRNRGLKG